MLPETKGHDTAVEASEMQAKIARAHILGLTHRRNCLCYRCHTRGGCAHKAQQCRVLHTANICTTSTYRCPMLPLGLQLVSPWSECRLWDSRYMSRWLKPPNRSELQPCTWHCIPSCRIRNSTYVAAWRVPGGTPQVACERQLLCLKKGMGTTSVRSHLRTSRCVSSLVEECSQWGLHAAHGHQWQCQSQVKHGPLEDGRRQHEKRRTSLRTASAQISIPGRAAGGDWQNQVCKVCIASLADEDTCDTR
jgi:hypothetical protein